MCQFTRSRPGFQIEGKVGGIDTMGLETRQILRGCTRKFSMEVDCGGGRGCETFEAVLVRM